MSSASTPIRLSGKFWANTAVARPTEQENALDGDECFD